MRWSKRSNEAEFSRDVFIRTHHSIRRSVFVPLAIHKGAGLYSCLVTPFPTLTASHSAIFSFFTPPHYLVCHQFKFLCASHFASMTQDLSRSDVPSGTTKMMIISCSVPLSCDKWVLLVVLLWKE